jgi:hypothetical protein
VENNIGVGAMFLRLDVPAGFTLVRHDTLHAHGFIAPEIDDEIIPPGQSMSLAGPAHVFLGWAGRTSNIYGDGELLTFTFTAAPDLPQGFHPIPIEPLNALGDSERPLRITGDFWQELDFYIEGGGFNTPFLLGDSDGDGQVTSADAVAIARWLLADATARATMLENGFRFAAADINGDRDITPADLILLKRRLVGHDVSW